MPIRINDALSVDYQAGIVTLFQESSSFALSDEDTQQLILWYVQGMCPICFDEIPLNDEICDKCFDKAKAARG